jgi:hypothetical protein
MRKALILLLLAGLSGCETWHDTFSSREKNRCVLEYAAMKIANDEAANSSGIEKIPHLQVVQIQTQLLIRDRCCRWSDTCLSAIFSD